MNFPNEDIDTLSELGLSMLQAKVYLSLAKEKNQTAQTISNNSGITRPDVYRILLQLEKTGLISRIIAKPEKFQAIPINEGISILIQRRIDKTIELQHKAHQLIQNFKPNGINQTNNENAQFMLIPKKEAFSNKVEKLLNNTQECICLLGSSKRLFFYTQNYLPVLKAALSRKVTSRIILQKPQNQEDLDKILIYLKSPCFNLKLIMESPHSSFEIFDKKEILISTTITDSPSQFPALWSNNKCLVDAFQDYFEYLWTKSRNIY